MKRPMDTAPFAAPESIEVVRGPKLRSGVPVVIGFLPAGSLLPNFKIPWYDSKSKKGYQRPPQEARINQLASDLRRDRTDLPTAVLLNIRSKDSRQAISSGSMNLGLLGQQIGGPIFHVVDGQHRVLALKSLFNEEPNRWAHFEIPFVCLLGATEDQEMEQFYIVNSTAKSVKTDLALALLRRRAEKNPLIYESLQEVGREWQVDAQGLVEKLAAESSIWKNKIRLPGTEKGDTTIPSTSMVGSLKPLLTSPYFGGLKTEQKVRLLDACWTGIRDILRPAFDQPKTFAIQKGVGVAVIHMILPHVIECIRDLGLLTTDADAYRRVLETPLSSVQGENASGEPVSGLQFWASAPKGAASSYSSSAGKRVLSAKLRQLLPEIQAEPPSE
jgi:DGQHR domain-containing protein